MNEIVMWAKQWPDATVRPISLLSPQATENNKIRRNRFYEQFGLTFDYEDTEQQACLSRPMTASALTPVESWRSNIRELDVHDYLGELLHNRDRILIQLADRDRAVTNWKDRTKQAEAKPIRWALRRTWRRLFPPLSLICVLLFLGGFIWLAIKNL